MVTSIIKAAKERLTAAPQKKLKTNVKVKRNPLTKVLDIPNLWLLTIPPGSSTAIAGIAYDYVNNDLFVSFGKGDKGWYWYSGVPFKVWVALTKAPSKGRFIVDNVKDNYPVELVG